MAATCSGQGRCQDLQTVRCAAYACAGNACGTRCAGDTECDAAYRCDAESGTCVSRDAAFCEKDHITLVAPSGDTTDCAPYKCEGTRCRDTCSSKDDCAAPNECTKDGYKCVAPLPPTGDPGAGGCACRATNVHGDGSGNELGAVGVALFLARRRRRRVD